MISHNKPPQSPPETDIQTMSKGIFGNLSDNAKRLATATLGGLAITSMWPTVGDVGQLPRVEVRANPFSPDNATIQTNVGKIKVSSNYPGLSIDALPYLQDDAVEKIKQNGLKESDFVPSALQVFELTSKFVVKFEVGAMIALFLASRRDKQQHEQRTNLRRIGKSIGYATLAATVTLGPSANALMQPQTYTWPPVVTSIGANKILPNLEAIEKHGDSIANVIASIANLGNQAIPEVESGSTQTTRLLLISDLHDENPFPALSEIIKTNQVGAIIIAGDIVNWGYPDELDIDGIRKSLSELKVPVIAVLGNHDAHAPNDNSLQKALSELPNVYVLQVSADGYVEVTINGIRISGFNDPGYFGDGGGSRADSERKSAEAFAKAVNENPPPPDIIVTHSNLAIGDPVIKSLSEKQIGINGHMHKPGLNIKKGKIGIQGGSTTAGGLFDLSDKPVNYFDILSINDRCTATLLTRFSIPGKLKDIGNSSSLPMDVKSIPLDLPFAGDGRVCTEDSSAPKVKAFSVTEPSTVGGIPQQP